MFTRPLLVLRTNKLAKTKKNAKNIETPKSRINN
jgi:hypothetical protein